MNKKRTDFEDVGETVKDSAQRVWLAGLGALSSAEERGGKIFKELVRKGTAYEKRAQGTFDGLKGQVGALAGKAQKGAAEAWDKVEEAWDDRVAGTLQRIGVPSREEIAKLTRKVEHLTELVEAKSKRPAAKRARKASASRSRTR
jgi:poly(hydroxyalkanoate) granule-associated protein